MLLLDVLNVMGERLEADVRDEALMVQRGAFDAERAAIVVRGLTKTFKPRACRCCASPVTRAR